MILFIAQYLLVGIIMSFLIEHAIRWSGNDVNLGERFWMIGLWPIMIAVFLVYFIKGILGKD